MKQWLFAALAALLVLSTSVSCTGHTFGQLQAKYAPTNTPTPTNTPSPTIILKSFHGRYVTAGQENDPGSIIQASILGPCGKFTRLDLANGKIALLTCHGRYVTAPISGSTRADGRLWQDSQPGDCSQFVVEEYENGIAFKTCAGKYLTAGDDSWEVPLQWSVVAETDKLDKWEVFTEELQP